MQGQDGQFRTLVPSVRTNKLLSSNNKVTEWYLGKKNSSNGTQVSSNFYDCIHVKDSEKKVLVVIC